MVKFVCNSSQLTHSISLIRSSAISRSKVNFLDCGIGGDFCQFPTRESCGAVFGRGSLVVWASERDTLACVEEEVVMSFNEGGESGLRYVTDERYDIN